MDSTAFAKKIIGGAFMLAVVAITIIWMTDGVLYLLFGRTGIFERTDLLATLKAREPMKTDL